MKTAPEILMVDDNPADIDLTSEILAQSKGHFHVNAVQSMASFWLGFASLPQKEKR